MYFVLASTRNLYKYVRVTIYSILKHNPDATIYLFAEDEQIEGIEDERVKIVVPNEMNEELKDSPNTNNFWTNMSFVRLFLHKWLPINKCIYLDIDTLVMQNLNNLWDIDISDYDCAMVRETHIEDKLYFNSGVMLMNLKRLREGNADKSIELVKTTKLQYPDQDAINECWNIMQIGPTYNSCSFTVECEEPHIKHYAGCLKPWHHRGINSGWWIDMERELNG